MGALRNFGPHPLREPPPHFALANQSAPFLRFLFFWLIYENLVTALKFALINIRNFQMTAWLILYDFQLLELRNNNNKNSKSLFNEKLKSENRLLFGNFSDTFGSTVWIRYLCSRSMLYFWRQSADSQLNRNRLESHSCHWWNLTSFFKGDKFYKYWNKSSRSYSIRSWRRRIF